VVEDVVRVRLELETAGTLTKPPPFEIESVNEAEFNSPEIASESLGKPVLASVPRDDVTQALGRRDRRHRPPSDTDGAWRADDLTRN
jgi:hypothetical protein